VSARAELIRALAAAAEPPTPALAAVAGALGLPRVPTAAEHTDLFTFQLHPYASVHLGPEGQLGGIARDRVAGFLRALGVTPPTEPDHLVVLLSAYAELVDLDDDGAGERARHARTALLHEHLWPWVPGFATRAAELGAAPYRRWASLLHDALEVEVAHLGPPPTLPAHLRDAPGLPDPREAPPGSFLDGLLAPVRSGLVLARADLARIARELDLGLRIGERAYLLRALLAQDGPATLRALADETTRQHGQVRGEDPTAGFRRDRLTAAGDLLADLATSSDTLPVPG
jgi:TorA maturation chaperone TorD